MLKLHKLFRYSKHFLFWSGREGLLSVWKFTIVYYLLKYSNISAPDVSSSLHLLTCRGAGKKSIYFLMTSFQQPRNVTHILVDCTFEFYDVFPLICFPGAAADLY